MDSLSRVKFDMLFYIDRSLANVDSSQEDIISAIEQIAQARRAGKHLVFGDRETIAALKDNSAIALTARRVYAKLYERLPQDKTYFDQLSWIVHVVAEQETLEIVNFHGKNVIKISARRLQNFSLLTETVLLAENQDDIEFYEFVVKSYILSAELGQIPVKYDPRGGGGSTTHREYAVLQQRAERLCLCILDGDCKYLGAGLGDTARSVQRIDRSDQPLCHILILPMREIENIIPVSIYRKVVADDPNRARAICSIEVIAGSSYTEARRYLDLKKGFKLYEYKSMNIDTPQFRYWNKVAEDLNVPVTCTAPNECDSKDNCRCYMFHGFGSSILSAVTSHLRENSMSGIDFIIDDIIKEDWRILGETILAWCCGSKSLVAV